MNLEFIEEGHIYKLDGQIIPSVNQVLPKPEFHVSPDVLEKARQEGIEAHSLIKMYHDTGQTYGEGLLERFDEWYQKQPYGKLLCYERPLATDAVDYTDCHGDVKRLPFAGTPDMIFEGAIVDFKRNYSNIKHYALQMAGYMILAGENGISFPGELVLIRDTGKKITEKDAYLPEAGPTFLKLLQRYYINLEVDEYYTNSNKE